MRDYNAIPFRKPRKSVGATVSRIPTPNSPFQSATTVSPYKQPSSLQTPTSSRTPPLQKTTNIDLFQHQQQHQPHDSPLASNASHTSTAPSTRSASPDFAHSFEPQFALVDQQQYQQQNSNTTGGSNQNNAAASSSVIGSNHSVSNNSNQSSGYNSGTVAHSNNSNTNNNKGSVNSPPRSNIPLSTTDALALRRQGPEVVIGRLRQDIQQYQTQYESTKSSLCKAEAIILELKSSMRQLKNTPQSKTAKNGAPDNSRVSDLQLQLDRVHAQLLTADMVRKELEDTLEAEQYTWELRVQDQERTIQACQAECATLAEELQECRQQWKKEEVTWREEKKALKEKSVVENNTDELQKKITALEQERRELQACLDEALQELEAVDAELQGENGVDELRKQNDELSTQLESLIEPLQSLFRWLLERDEVEDADLSENIDNLKPLQLVQAIQKQLESQELPPADWKSATERVKELESQISVYRGDLQVKEETSSELRSSLKEAVALLKPLQDAVAKADRDRTNLNEKIKRLERDTESLKQMKQELNNKEDELEDMESKVQSLEIELSKLKLDNANQMAAQHRAANGATAMSSRDSLTKARQDLQAKRSAEKNLRQMLHNVSYRSSPTSDRSVEENNRAMPTIDVTAFEDLKSELSAFKVQLADKDSEMQVLQKELNELRDSNDEGKLNELQSRVFELQGKLTRTNEELKDKKDTERALNRSLKEALTLLRPLQMHLEEAEVEKKELEGEVRLLRKQLANDSSVYSRTISTAEREDNIKDLEETIRQLEKENSQLHDALDDMSHSLNASHVSTGTGLSQKNESRLREELVELKSRVEVTEGQLEDAYIENHSLAEALQRRENSERALAEELQMLKEHLRFSGAAGSQNSTNVPSSRSSEPGRSASLDQSALYAQKASEFDKQMRGSARQEDFKMQYRLT